MRVRVWAKVRVRVRVRVSCATPCTKLAVAEQSSQIVLVAPVPSGPGVATTG